MNYLVLLNNLSMCVCQHYKINNMDVEEVEKLKVICLGDSAVGKSKFVIH